PVSQPTPPELTAFRTAAREWLRANMTPLERRADGALASLDGYEPSPERVADARRLQRRVFEGGYAGITCPREWGGQGLTLDHEQVVLDEARGYDMPTRIFAYSLNI